MPRVRGQRGLLPDRGQLVHRGRQRTDGQLGQRADHDDGVLRAAAVASALGQRAAERERGALGDAAVRRRAGRSSWASRVNPPEVTKFKIVDTNRSQKMTLITKSWKVVEETIQTLPNHRNSRFLFL